MHRAAVRVASRWAADEFYDKNSNNPNVWTYEPDLSRPVSNDSDINDGRLRLTWQATPKVKVGGLYVQQTARNWPSMNDTTGAAVPGTSLIAYEVSPYHYFPVERQVTADVTSPITNRLLFDGAVKTQCRAGDPRSGARTEPGDDQRAGAVERASVPLAASVYINRPSYVYYYRAAVSYITGAHSLKVGDRRHLRPERRAPTGTSNPVSYRFNNGVPNQITMRALPIDFRVNIDHQFGAYVQDRWTIDRLTLNAGLRYDWFAEQLSSADDRARAARAGTGFPIRRHRRACRCTT